MNIKQWNGDLLFTRPESVRKKFVCWLKNSWYCLWCGDCFDKINFGMKLLDAGFIFAIQVLTISQTITNMYCMPQTLQIFINGIVSFATIDLICFVLQKGPG